MSPSPFRKAFPNGLTISRVAVIMPIALVLAYYPTSEGYVVALMLSLYAMVTDFFDGYLSRKWGVVSDLGRLLDPVADKLLVAVLLVMLCAHGIGHPLAVSAIVFRELFISGLREFLQERRIVLHVSKIAKYKTASQMVACVGLLLAGIWPQYSALLISAEAVLWVAAALTMYTGLDYTLAARRHW
jgi:cardiolipin synthase (CMP-forming)